jgi:hypothetical protein
MNQIIISLSMPNNGLLILNISTTAGVKEKLCYTYIVYYILNIKHFNLFHSSSAFCLKILSIINNKYSENLIAFLYNHDTP